MSKNLLAGVSLAALLVIAQTAHAEAARSGDVVTQADNAAPVADPSTGAAEGKGGLEDIIVTATRRPVNLQKVSATIEAVTADKLKTFNVNGVLDLPTLVSGLVVTPSGGNNLYLRGIGSPSTGLTKPKSQSILTAYTSLIRQRVFCRLTILTGLKCSRVRRARSMGATSLAA